MEEYIENIIYLIKKSELSKSEKIIIQLFIEVCLYKKLITIGSKYVNLTKNSAEYFLNHKYDFGSFGREKVINHRTINNKKLYDMILIMDKYIEYFKNLFYRFLSMQNIIRILFRIILFRNIIKKDYKLKFIFENYKCKKYWLNNKNIIFISLNDLKLLSSDQKYIYKIKSNLKSKNIQISLKEIINKGFEKAIIYNLKKNKIELLKIKKRKSFLNLISFFITKIFKYIIKDFDKAIFIDNTQGLLAAANNIHEVINSKESLILNSQHGSGYYEFKCPDFYLSERSPAYSYELIGFYASKFIRPHYPVNGKNFKIKNNNFKNHTLIIEGADIFTRNINCPNLISSKYTIELYKEIIDGLEQNNINCLLRRHPKSKINWSCFNSNYFIENLEDIPSKFIPDPNDFKSFILVGLGHSLMYPLLNCKNNFFIIADPSHYNLSKTGLKLINFLIINKILIDPSKIYDFKNNYNNYLLFRKNINISNLISKNARIMEDWIFNM